MRLVLAGLALALVIGGCVGASEEGAYRGTVPVVGTEALRTELAAPDPPMLLDVRTPGEYGEGHIAGAVLVPLYALPEKLDGLRRYTHRRIVTYCEIGARSEAAARILIGEGFDHVENYRAGMAEWRRTEPVERGGP
jgi:rhodanese-related sulfurtransferase